MDTLLRGARIHITGTVQGVGFRPFVYGLATRLDINGWVRNTSAGVDIEVDGTSENIERFIADLRQQAPPLARIDELQVESIHPNGFQRFEIQQSTAISDAFQPISPDVSICDDCLDELFDPGDRRFLYPFINCTNCGPRFTIIQDIPYDRPNTTMAGFALCPQCAAEYKDPLNRRFHAQPVACPTCGPHVWLEKLSDGCSLSTLTSANDSSYASLDAIYQTQQLLAQGKIIAIKGIGGFHLACDATNQSAVSLLRERKLRVDKPFALMMLDLETIERHCYLNDAERSLLISRQRPIVLLRRRPDSPIVRDVAPYQDNLGVMLPYTPLHYLLFSDLVAQKVVGHEKVDGDHLSTVLVMTSGNQSEEPIAIDNQEARERLPDLADAFLMNNRPIHTRCDDSVARILADEQPSILRRSRGFAPDPILLTWESPQILATGPELKNTFCLARDRYAFISHHIGDLENYETLRSYEQGITNFQRMFRVSPQYIAYDLHPNYLATRYAIDRANRDGLPSLGIQHHHAHIASCMAEHGLPNDAPVIGVAFDGSGYGEDGEIWGGEFMLASYTSYQRIAHFSYMPLPGGDAAIRKPARTALAYLWNSNMDWDIDLPPIRSLSEEERAVLHAQLSHRLNTPLTSSVGRLFDAVSALIGIRQSINYEAQAAIELEAMVDPEETQSYPVHITQYSGTTPSQIEFGSLLKEVVNDWHTGTATPRIAARFHNALAQCVLDVSQLASSKYGVSQVVLSGGVWQNITLLEKTVKLLTDHHYMIYYHHLVPTNDGGISLGQAAIASQKVITGMI